MAVCVDISGYVRVLGKLNVDFCTISVNRISRYLLRTQIGISNLLIMRVVSYLDDNPNILVCIRIAFYDR